MRYSVGELDAANRQQVLKIWQDSLDGGGEFDRKLGWFYQDGPAGPGTVLVLYHEQTETVGATGLGRRLWYAQGEPCVAALHADFAITRTHRSMLPALTLQRESTRRARSGFSFSYGFPNHAAIPIYERIGYHTLETVTRFTRILHHKKYLRRVLRNGVVSAAAGRPVDWLIGLRRAPRLLSARLSNQLLWPPTADDSFDRLFDEARHQFALIGDRSAKFLNWRFRNRPGRPFDLVALRHKGSKELVAQAVVEQREGVAFIHDLMASGDQHLCVLLDLLASALARSDCDSVSVRFLGSRRVATLLQSVDFHPRESNQPMVVDAGEAWARAASLLRDEGDWYVTSADEDA